MKMKRIVSTLLAGVMTLSLVACGSTEPAAPAAEPDNTATATETAAPAAEPAKLRKLLQLKLLIQQILFL